MKLRTDRSLLRATERSTRYLRIALTAPVAPSQGDRSPVRVAIVLDRSGSMSGERKFPLAHQAVKQSLALLQPRDRFALVVYNAKVDVLAPCMPASHASCSAALERLSDVVPRGGTDLHAGWMTGASQLLEQLPVDDIKRVLLLTDGQANQGITEPHALADAAADLRRRGVATSTFGVGADFDERLLRDIAHEGGGQSYFIESPEQITDLLTSELGEALEVVRRGVELQVALPLGVEGELLNRYRTSHAPGSNTLRINVGDLTSGQELSFVLRLTFPEDREGATTSVGVSLRSADAPAGELEGELSWTYDDHSANDDQPRDVRVDREVATLYAGRARAEATEANRYGDFQRARRVLESTARRIQRYASGDPVLTSLWRSLMAEREQYAQPMSPMAQKFAFFAAEGSVKNRDIQGKARRRTE